MITRRVFVGMLAGIAAVPRQLFAAAPWRTVFRGSVVERPIVERPMPIAWGCLSDDGVIPPPAIYTIIGRSVTYELSDPRLRYAVTLQADDGAVVKLTCRSEQLFGEVGDRLRWVADEWETTMHTSCASEGVNMIGSFDSGAY